MSTTAFNPEEHLTKLPVRRKNRHTNTWEYDHADYLEVKWRMVWFRDQNPENTKTTIRDKIIDFKNEFAFFELEVTDSKGNIEIGVGSETGADFSDYIEKAYTKAYGRALAALGYGTQFAPELEEGERIVDSPIKKEDGSFTTTAQDEPMTDPQRRAIFAIYNTLGYTENQMKEIIQKRYNKSDGKLLSKQEASDLIDHLNSLKRKPNYTPDSQPH
jgi:hypothetical protein